jgi:hypothetical protein
MKEMLFQLINSAEGELHIVLGESNRIVSGRCERSPPPQNHVLSNKPCLFEEVTKILSFSCELFLRKSLKKKRRKCTFLVTRMLY